MTSEPETIKAQSLLAIDLGTMTTRASLFDVVDGAYQFIATGSSPTTLDAPISDALTGLFQAVQALQEVCGRSLLDGSRRFVVPAQPDGSGVDQLVMTLSAGPRLKIALAGLLDDFSLKSAGRLIHSLPGEVVEKISLNDLRPRAAQLDDVLAAKPDVLLLAGGTEGGASRSVYELVELAGLVCQVLRDTRKPVVMYCGNQALVENVEEFLGRLTRIRIAPNLRPSLTEENYAPALEVYSRIYSDVRMDQYHGLREVAEKWSAAPVPAAYGFGRMIRFLSQIYDSRRGVMGLDLGSASLTTASARSGELDLTVFPFGMGAGMENLLKQSKLEDFSRWIPFEMDEDELRDRLYQITLCPHQIPASTEGLAVCQAAARQALRLAMQKLQPPQAEALPYEPYLISGSVLTQAPDPMSALLTLLDGIQPVGVTTFVLDQNNLLAQLGAAAQVNPLLPVQLLETSAFLNLGTVICPVTHTRGGADVLKIRLEYDDGSSIKLEAPKGSLLRLPVRNGQEARVHIESRRRIIIDPVSGERSGTYQVKGGACGVVIDARGRSIRLPNDRKKRLALLEKWNHELGL
ncbi:MAG: glutamate mutase L [Anaerolineaceae bacterium]